MVIDALLSLAALSVLHMLFRSTHVQLMYCQAWKALWLCSCVAMHSSWQERSRRSKRMWLSSDARLMKWLPYGMEFVASAQHQYDSRPLSTPSIIAVSSSSAAQRTASICSSSTVSAITSGLPLASQCVAVQHTALCLDPPALRS
jgi:hypothetical protein